MRFGIYARGITGVSGGVKVYIKELTNGIIKSLNKKDHLFIIHNSEINIFTKKDNVEEIKINSKSKLVADLIKAPKIINKLSLDVVLFPKNVIPFGIKAKKILTIHDLAYYLPQYNAYKFLDTIYMKFMIRNSARRANKIIAVSNNTKKDIIRILKIDPNKIRVIYEGVGKQFKIIKNRQDLEKIKLKYSLNKPFIFYAGSISPRKNIKRLVNAFNKLNNKNLELVITGNKLWNNKEEMDLINKNQNIKVLGLVPEEDLPKLYNLALFYVYPSLYEGFGLPVLEAQACGCPVIAANTSSLPEVAGEGAMLVDPYNEEEILASIIKVANNKKLKNNLIKKGFKNVGTFNWDKTAKHTLEVIKNVQR